MHPFYQKPKIVQWTIALLLSAILGVVFYAWFKATVMGIWSILLIPFLTPFMQFCCAPLFTLTGVYKYVSPMLLIYSPSATKYDLHSGTSFDYLTVLGGKMQGRNYTQVLLSYYLEGLLEIIRETEAGETPEDIQISGTSYFFSENTARRLGFEFLPPESHLKFNLYLNYIDLLWMYSLSKGKLTFPNLKNAQMAKTTGKQLVAHKAVIERLHAYLSKDSQSLKQGNHLALS